MMPSESKKYLIVGLGNIGSEYKNTRHNIGFDIVNCLASELKSEFKSGRHGDIASVSYKGRSLIILKPSTFMNLSGKALQYWLKKENIPLENLFVIHDDIALSAGMIRIRKMGGDAGHNGVSHIIYTLETENFARLRMGIGSDFSKGRQVEYVLGEWTEEELALLKQKIPLASEAIKSFVCVGPDKTMNFYNNK
jgi:PTH1 family peptidyl-tRNA hydrolase